MNKRDYLVGFFGAFNAFAIAAGTDGNYMAAAIFFIVSNVCLYFAGPAPKGGVNA